MAYKFYFTTWTNKKFDTPEGKVLNKFGITHNKEVLNRFNPDVDDGYVKSQLYNDWDIKVDFSIWFDTKEEAEACERMWLTETFPKSGPTKVWIEKVLGCPTMDYYAECTGITELRLLSQKQRKWVLWQLYTMRDEMRASAEEAKLLKKQIPKAHDGPIEVYIADDMPIHNYKVLEDEIPF